MPILQFQCQDCGKLGYSDETSSKNILVATKKLCECGGQMRRDKNIFCPCCLMRKSDENCSSDIFHLTESETEAIRDKHGVEEME
jgi:hypothetical protein